MQTNATYTILYADDDPDDLFFVSDAFKHLSPQIEVITQPDGVSALHYLRHLPEDTEPPCVILLDINMPKVNGKETLLRIRQLPRYIGVPIILFTTSSYREDMLFALEHEAGFISKPLDQQQMSQISKEILQHCTGEVRRLAR